MSASSLESPVSTGTWLPIDSAPSAGTRMFVVKAFLVSNGFTNGAPYTSDPYCVWRNDDGSFARWPHQFSPTHWTPLPGDPA